jgi:hypothetical protein
MNRQGPVGKLLSSEPLEKYRREAEEQERKFARAREETERQERRALRAAVSNEKWGELARRLAALERAHQATRESVLDVAQATSSAFDAVADEHAELPREQRDEIRALRTEVAKLATRVAEMHESRAEFRFARERDERSEVPNFLPRRDLN